jgi:hypothetical protein
MTFVCQKCAEGLSPEGIDAEATYPDAELGGTDEHGGFLCKDCAAGGEDEEDEEGGEDIAAGMTRYFEREPHGMTPPGFKREQDELRRRSPKSARQRPVLSLPRDSQP